MIHDKETNLVYFSELLKSNPKFAETCKQIVDILNINKIDCKFLPDTRDIWARDYMPIQTSIDRFVQFTYNPDYLQPKKYQKTISDVDSICKKINIQPIKSKLIVDGGNIVRYSDKVIMCDKVFNENKNIVEKNLIKELKEILQIDKIIFVPWDKSDIIGHADGMVRFVNESTVLINDYTKEKPEYQRCLRMSLQNAGLDWIELPYNPYINTTTLSAEGIYTNFLQMNQLVIVPTFNRHEDDTAVKILEQVFKGQTIATVKCNEIAKKGGVLNCITWNILA
jgi:agmatine deiminase